MNERHVSLERLLAEADMGPSALANALGESEQTVTNWGKRGVSKGGAMKAQGVLGISATFVMAGDGPARTGAMVKAATRDGDEINVPLLAAAGSMGDGVDQQEDHVVGRLSLSPSWITQTLKPLSAPEKLRFIHGLGDSMDPTFADGDILLVDSGITDVKIDGVYVLEAQGRLFIKRVRQRINGSFEISSDNQNIKTVDLLDGTHPVNVLGRVVWVWNGRKL